MPRRIGERCAGGDGMVARVDEKPVASGKQGKGSIKYLNGCHQEGDQARSKTEKERQTGRERTRVSNPGSDDANEHSQQGLSLA